MLIVLQSFTRILVQLYETVQLIFPKNIFQFQHFFSPSFFSLLLLLLLLSHDLCSCQPLKQRTQRRIWRQPTKASSSNSGSSAAAAASYFSLGIMETGGNFFHIEYVQEEANKMEEKKKRKRKRLKKKRQEDLTTFVRIYRR